ncbi:protein BIG GRAIN 1-like A [Andrographis paniculata]|uniref:protein BIG GRAIN 1-like A n=1 Tax=Andrographis paniculata TaxID=175694 RepID=UPI0021E8B6F5|nr:protein BIG GRAIN 1-like A [Andrographis paniculata]
MEKMIKENHHKYNAKPRKSHRNTASFSSTLLDEICRSIDGGDCAKACDNNGQDGSSNFARRTCFVDKWMIEQSINANSNNNAVRRRSSILPDWEDWINDTNSDSMFLSSKSNSISSGSTTSGGARTSSDIDFPGPLGLSCFSTRPKPVRVTCEETKNKSSLDQDDHVKSRRSTALKFYAGLKKLKQPISPGGKLTSFINSIFANGAKKKFEKHQQPHDHLQSEPSSTSSFSRFYSNKYRPRDKIATNGDQRTVRSHPSGEPRRHRSIHYYNEECHRRPPLPPKSGSQIPRKNEFYVPRRIRRDEDDDADVDAASESSSDLFEIDHLSVIGSSRRFSEQLPVYESTYFF